MLIRDIMNTSVCQCTEDTPLAEVYELIQTCPSGYVVVIDSNQHRIPLGIVNEHSICDALVKGGRRNREFTAGSLMNSRIQKIDENTDVAELANQLDSSAVTIVAVSRNREFRGVVDGVELETAARKERTRKHSAASIVGMLGQAIPASVEIPAFGWLK